MDELPLRLFAGYMVIMALFVVLLLLSDEFGLNKTTLSGFTSLPWFCGSGFSAMLPTGLSN